jgi:hypothetical protein
LIARHARDAAQAIRFWCARAIASISKAMALHSTAPPAVESGPAPATPTSIPTTENSPMTTKVSSKRVAAIAGRILAGKPYSEADAKALAASVVTQARPKKKVVAKKKRPSRT